MNNQDDSFRVCCINVCHVRVRVPRELVFKYLFGSGVRSGTSRGLLALRLERAQVVWQYEWLMSRRAVLQVVVHEVAVA